MTNPASSSSIPEAELCANCGFTYFNHISNTGAVHPDWKPSGKFSHDKTVNAAASPPTPDSAPPNPLEYCRDCGGSYTKHREGCPVVGSPLQSGAGSVGEEPSVEQWIESRRSPDSPDIRGLLDALEIRAEDFWTGPDHDEDPERWAEFQTCHDEARNDIESAFSVLREEVERLGYVSDKWKEIAENNAAQWEASQSELARLQAEQLTPEEAGYMLDRIPPESDVEGGYYPIERPIIAKLRSRLRGQTND